MDFSQNGVKPHEDVTIDTSVQFALMAGAFTGGQGDYVALFEPTASMVEQEGKGYVLTSIGKDSGEIPYTAYFCSKEYMAENPDVILLGSGSEVSTLAEAAELLKEDGVTARVVSCPSEGLFRRQPKEYQETIIPRNAKVFALTAGLPVIFAELVGGNGKVYGLESFGFSAPFKVLDEKLGFTAENMRKEILSYLAE